MWAPSTLYELYVAALGASVHLAVALSLLVSADRVLNVLKFAFICMRSKLTGRLPKDAWVCEPLPKDPDAYPRVSAGMTAPPPLQEGHLASCGKPSAGPA